MTTPEPAENSPHYDRKAVVDELIRGREVAARLVVLLPAGETTGELAGEVLRSLSRALSVLESGESSEVSQNPAGVGSLCSDDRRSESYAGKRRIRPAGDRRRFLRRRSHPYERITVTSPTIDDNYTWRKYGQKEIHSSKHPRSYFRCTHKHDQGCQATRQVQRSEDDLTVFQITYMGHHTCRNAIRGNLQTGEGPEAREPYLISFAQPADPSDGGGRQHHPSPPIPAVAAPKKERAAAAADDVLSNLSRGDSSSEYLMLPDIADLGIPTPAATGISGAAAAAAASDIGDVTSALQHSSCVSSGSLQDMEFMSDSFEFVAMFDFDRDELDFKFSG